MKFCPPSGSKAEVIRKQINFGGSGGILTMWRTSLFWASSVVSLWIAAKRSLYRVSLCIGVTSKSASFSLLHCFWASAHCKVRQNILLTIQKRTILRKKQNSRAKLVHLRQRKFWTSHCPCTAAWCIPDMASAQSSIWYKAWRSPQTATNVMQGLKISSKPILASDFRWFSQCYLRAQSCLHFLTLCKSGILSTKLSKENQDDEVHTLEKASLRWEGFSGSLDLRVCFRITLTYSDQNWQFALYTAVMLLKILSVSISLRRISFCRFSSTHMKSCKHNTVHTLQGACFGSEGSLSSAAQEKAKKLISLKYTTHINNNFQLLDVFYFCVQQLPNSRLLISLLFAQSLQRCSARVSEMPVAQFCI